MSLVSVDNFINGLNSICLSKPIYKAMHDGSDGSCDAIGFIRGGLLRSGATKIRNMKDINQFVRKTDLNRHAISASSKRGSIVLKVNPVDYKIMPLPSKYRQGGDEYNGDLNNYTDIGVVVNESPVKIMHMTHDGIVVDDSIEEWNEEGWLPYVEEGDNPPVTTAKICSNGSNVKIYANPSFSCKDFAEVEDGTLLMVIKDCEPWMNVVCGNINGYVLKKFVNVVETSNNGGLSQKDREELEKAYVIIGKLLGYMK